MSRMYSKPRRKSTYNYNNTDNDFQKYGLLNKERKYLIAQFPNIKPFYENTLHNKVDIKNRFYVNIPVGKKYFIWFTYLNNQPVCISLNYNYKANFLQHLKKIACNFDPILCTGKGTILYGTHLSLNKKNVFSIENIFFYKSKKVMFETQYMKLQIIGNILKNCLSPKIYLKREYLFKLPLITTSYDALKVKMEKLPYTSYCIQHRSWTENIYLNEKVSIQSTQTAVFTVKAEMDPDTYSLYCQEQDNLVNIGYAYVGDIKTSKFMNKLFRCIRENDNIDFIEESEDEDTFEDTRLNKFMLNTQHNIECLFNNKYNKWVPIKVTDQKVTNKNELMFFEK